MIVDESDAGSLLSTLIDRAILGEDVIITRDGQPVARLVPHRERIASRVPGTARDVIEVGPDFDRPLPEELRRSFEWP